MRSILCETYPLECPERQYLVRFAPTLIGGVIGVNSCKYLSNENTCSCAFCIATYIPDVQSCLNKRIPKSILSSKILALDLNPNLLPLLLRELQLLENICQMQRSAKPKVTERFFELAFLGNVMSTQILNKTLPQ